MSIPQLSGKVFLIITGASQGIGRQIAQTFGPLLGDGSLVLLLARNVNGLKETAATLPEGCRVDIEGIDLSAATAEDLKAVITKSLGDGGPTQYGRAVIVHNAGSVGDVSKPTVAMNDFKIWREYYDLNVFSPAILNGVFMEIFNNETKLERLVINITSLCAIQPFNSMGYYGSGKAAREMFFKVFAGENPTVNVLNYSPGPVETDMLQTICAEVGDPQVKANFNDMKKNRSALTTEQTINRLVKVLKGQNYKSGDHVDYYDNL